MGVAGLWELIHDAKEEVDLKQDCCGKKFAVDLSSWIVQCSTVKTFSNMSQEYICYRSIFYRALNLSQLGILLVFVMDSPKASKLKRVQRGMSFYNDACKYKRLLMSMGFPVLESDGEGEKLCAELNSRKLVDGVLTEDGDALLYGANTVYKAMMKENKIHTATKYSLLQINAKLGITREDLVSFALLSKGDFCEGVPGIGDKTFEKLLVEMKKNKSESVLDRILAWRENEALSSLEVSQQLKPYKIELNVRRKALQLEKFPYKSVKDEYMIPYESGELIHAMELPNLSETFKKISKEANLFKNDIGDFMTHVLPAYTMLALHGHLPGFHFKINRLVKKCKVNFAQHYLVEWSTSGISNFPTEYDKQYYEFKVPAVILERKFPTLTSEFNKQLSPVKGVKKRNIDPASTCKKMTDFFSVKKSKLNLQK